MRWQESSAAGLSRQCRICVKTTKTITKNCDIVQKIEKLRTYPLLVAHHTTGRYVKCEVGDNISSQISPLKPVQYFKDGTLKALGLDQQNNFRSARLFACAGECTRECQLKCLGNNEPGLQLESGQVKYRPEARTRAAEGNFEGAETPFAEQAARDAKISGEVSRAKRNRGAKSRCVRKSFSPEAPNSKTCVGVLWRYGQSPTPPSASAWRPIQLL